MPAPRVDGSALTRILLISLFASVAVVLVCLAASINTWPQQSAAAESFPPPGQLFEIAGADMHLDCRGSGSPTIIIESGLMSGSASWLLVHDDLAQVTRVCAYDRPGMDWSEPTGGTVAGRAGGQSPA